MITVGAHIFAEFYGVEPELIAKKEVVKKKVEKIVLNSNLNKIKSVFHQFQPYGVTGVVLICESHISIHTWPEYKLMTIDIFTCGDFDKAKKVFELFIEEFKPKDYKHQIVERGYYENREETDITVSS